MDALLHNTLLFDFYGDLLTEKQKNIYHMYHCEDLSLAEIGSRLNISRQAVNFSIKQAQRSFLAFEEVLGLVEQHIAAQNHVGALRQALENKDYVAGNKILTELSKLV
ncbi:MAG: hypothetical protein FWC93_00865 [Defluviitaleaceae bacterium]|nr:hypothetical protein [Defluviitaleaceae bacterium]